ncbi:hypothetical protein CKA32_002209 [Geitlerinema sp. FC II]|nr:hypothetical protein CKA32_002209 [Geitlerinema sp. FC II]
MLFLSSHSGDSSELGLNVVHNKGQDLTECKPNINISLTKGLIWVK